MHFHIYGKGTSFLRIYGQIDRLTYVNMRKYLEEKHYLYKYYTETHTTYSVVHKHPVSLPVLSKKIIIILYTQITEPTNFIIAKKIFCPFLWCTQFSH